uniref:WAS/WASL interacting protein family member 3 n=1 Tax=Oreochromis niloticus TaxID=8128 RepID=A0A669E5T9_ORENI
MPVPPPPPPPPPAAPPPPPPPSAALPQFSGGGGGGRNALLADIQKGTKLKKVTQVNDRSAPVVNSRLGKCGASSGGMAPVGPSLSGLFAGGFPTLRPTGQRDLAGKQRSKPPSTAYSPPQPLLLPPPLTAACTRRLSLLPLPFHLPSLCSSPPPPPQAFQDRPGNKPPPLPSCPPPPPPSQATKPMWLPIQHSQHSSVSLPSPPPPPPPPPPPTVQPLSAVPGDRSSGCFYSPPSSAVYSETSRFPVLRDNPLGPPPPPPPPPLPLSITPSCPSTLPPPPPMVAPVPSPAMRSLPPSYPCNAPTRRPPAIPRSAGRWTTGCKNASLMRLKLLICIFFTPADDFESKFQFHPVEDLPPPDEFKPFPRIYPSKENRGSHKAQLLRISFSFLSTVVSFAELSVFLPPCSFTVNPKPPGIRTHLR